MASKTNELIRDPEDFRGRSSARECVLCTSTEENRLAIVNSKKQMWKYHEWSALKRWWEHPEGGQVNSGIVSVKKLQRHMAQCLGEEL